MTNLTAFIVVNGCHENRMDAALLKRYLTEEQGFTITDDYKASDIIIVMGCSVTSHMENESIDLIDHFRKYKSSETRLAVHGCISRLKPELAMDNLDGVLPLEKIDSLMRMDKEARRLAVNKPYKSEKYVKGYLNGRKNNVILDYMNLGGNGGHKHNFSTLLKIPLQSLKKYKDYLESSINVTDDKTFSIKISTGCTGDCSYCTIKFSRGKVKSKPVDDVMAEFESGLKKGFKHFALLGTDIGDYGKDIDSDISYLLEKMVSRKEDFRIRLRNLNPRWVIPNRRTLKKILRSCKIAYIQSPIQSANNRILELMNRGYQAQDFISTMQNINLEFPSVVLRTQLIVGFPTETEEEFEDSFKLVKKKIFDYADVFRFTPRDRTFAATIEPKVPFDVIMKRYRKLFFKTLLNQSFRKLTTAKCLQSVR
jgi:threonylcarbamoyladenosine tRNA methylthiotransferase MtaB